MALQPGLWSKPSETSQREKGKCSFPGIHLFCLHYWTSWWSSPEGRISIGRCQLFPYTLIPWWNTASLPNTAISHREENTPTLVFFSAAENSFRGQFRSGLWVRGRPPPPQWGLSEKDVGKSIHSFIMLCLGRSLDEHFVARSCYFPALCRVLLGWWMFLYFDLCPLDCRPAAWKSKKRLLLLQQLDWQMASPGKPIPLPPYSPSRELLKGHYLAFICCCCRFSFGCLRHFPMAVLYC